MLGPDGFHLDLDELEAALDSQKLTPVQEREAREAIEIKRQEAFELRADLRARGLDTSDIDAHIRAYFS